MGFNKAIKNANKELIKQEKEPNELLSKKDEMDWLEIFEDKKSEVLELDAKIAQNDREINQKIYQLDELDEQEIKFIEESC